MHDILNEPIQIVEPVDTSKAIRIAVLLDESGSMLSCSKDTVDNLNSYLDEQATRDEPVLVSVYTFNSNDRLEKSGVRNRFRSVDAKTAPRLKRNNDLFENPDIDPILIYAPAGGTPLYDAIATVINEETTGIPTLVVILTDGMENASKEYRTRESIQNLIKQQEADGWTFVFLMAGLTRVESEAYTSGLMGRNYEGATMTYEKGLEDVATQGLVSATMVWESSARSARAAGKKIDTEAVAKNFYAPKDRDIKKK